MPADYPEVDRAAALSALRTHGNKQAAADALGWSRSRVQRVLQSIPEGCNPVAEEIPEADIPFEERLALMKRRNSQRIAHVRAQEWQRVHIPISGPYGLCWFGDPHLDDPYADLEAVERDAAICASTDGMLGINGGDTINNWVGFLKKIYAEQPTTASEGWELVDWFMNDLGIRWALWLLGNHDTWEHGERTFRNLNCQKIVMRDWEAKVRLVSPDGGECALWARHDFKGTSIYNELHGQKRSAMFTGGEADIYAAFHRHNWATSQGELDNGRRYALIRARGYKMCDDYAVKGGFSEQRSGQSVVTVVTPRPGEQPLVSVFQDVAEGADFLAFKRRKLAA